MNAIKYIKIGALAAVLGVTSISCSKKQDGAPQPVEPMDRATIIKNLKNLKFSFTEPGSENYNYSSATNNFTYVEPSTGITYSEPANGFTYSEGQTTLSGNLAKGGGIFEVDGKSIKLDYVFCSSGNEKDAFGNTGKVGSSSLVGIAGNFDEKDPAASKLDYLVFAYVNSEKANGKYDVIFRGDQDNTDLSKFAFFYIIDLSKVKSSKDFETSPDAKFYFSVDGSMTFNNGGIKLNDIKMAELLKSKDLGNTVPATGELSCE